MQRAMWLWCAKPAASATWLAGSSLSTTRRFAADATTAASVDICHSSARLIDDISKEQGIHRGLTSVLDTTFRRAHDRGHGADDLASAHQSMRG